MVELWNVYNTRKVCADPKGAKTVSTSAIVNVAAAVAARKLLLKFSFRFFAVFGTVLLLVLSRDCLSGAPHPHGLVWGDLHAERCLDRCGKIMQLPAPRSNGILAEAH